MRRAPGHIDGAEHVLNAFGYWPSCHDAKLRDVHHDAGEGAVTFTVEAFEMTDEVEERIVNGTLRPEFRLTKPYDVRFRFVGVSDVVLPTRGDTLDMLDLGEDRDAGGRFLVILESCIGLPQEGFGGSFRARSGAVLGVVARASAVEDAPETR